MKNDTDAYISKSPENVREKLRKIRALIQEAAPGAAERTDYFEMPGYSYEGYDYDGMFVWFSFKGSNVRLHVRPPVIENHKKELEGFVLTKSIVSFPAQGNVPGALVKKLVKASIQAMKNRSASLVKKSAKKR